MNKLKISLLGIFCSLFLFASAQNNVPPNESICGHTKLQKMLWKNHPEMKTAYEAAEVESRHDDDDPGIMYTIPVVFHIMHANGFENIPDSLVASAVEILNEGFGRYGCGGNTNELGADANIRFCLATVNPDGNPDIGITRHVYPNTLVFEVEKHDAEVKAIVNWDPKRYLNVWVVSRINFGAINGYAYFPSGIAGTELDGIVMEFLSVGRPADFVCRGNDLVHEAGHYLNLIHTWGDGGCEIDDRVEDTPLCSFPFYTTNPFCFAPFQCGFENERQVQNYMDYSSDECRNMFSIGQINRMRSAIIKFRPSLVGKESLVRSGCTEGIDSLEAENYFVVYPNPSTTGNFLMYMNFEIEDIGEIHVTDVMGRRVHTEKNVTISKGVIPLELDGVSKGTYYVVVVTSVGYFRSTILIGD